MTDNQSKGILSAVGLCRKAGKLIIGTDAVCDALKTRRVLLVFASDGASDNTKKRLCDKCTFYKTEIHFADISPDDLGAAIGKGPTACVGITDENFKKLIESKLIQQTKGRDS